MTLMISEGWPAFASNAVLNATCNKGQPFHDAYEAAKKGILPAKDKGILTAEKIKVDKKGTVDEIVFVLLSKPIAFEGVT